LASNVGQNRFEALNITMDIADEGSFHASNLSIGEAPRARAGRVNGKSPRVVDRQPYRAFARSALTRSPVGR
jgi:hypothetical protein